MQASLMLKDVVITAFRIPGMDKHAFDLVYMFDLLQIYDEDIDALVLGVCENNFCNVVTLLWAAKMGLDNNLGDDCCDVFRISINIKKAKVKLSTDYPFAEARKLLKESYLIDIPLHLPDLDGGKS